MFQSIKVNGEVFNIFFDSGCSDFIVRKSAVERLGPHVTLISNIPVSITGVGKKSTSAEHGIYRVQLPLASGETAVLRGTCLTDITGEFPQFPLKEAEKDLCFAAGPLAKTFPKLPSHIGGNVDFMIGMKYLKYHPKPIFQIPTGLTIFKSIFRSADGTTGIIGGPHESFSKIRFQSHFTSPSFVSEMSNIMMVSPLSESDLVHSSFKANSLKSLDNAENAGSQISYHCVSCRECKDCKTHDSIESTSLKEEAEQTFVESSVSIDIESHIATVRLPVLYNPAKWLAPNKPIALKVYEQQIGKLNKPENTKDDLLSLNVGDLNFAKHQRGKKPEAKSNVIPNDWDDPIPSELRDTWLNNFKLMQDLKSIHFKRCIDVCYSSWIGRMFSLSIGRMFSLLIGRMFLLSIGRMFSLLIGRMFLLSIGRMFSLLIGRMFLLSIGRMFSLLIG
uniref:Uncharacterized protein n=1 Tax=Clytia hemisphaerica TaxID=252671 RepID=A0A7M5UL97_9CNID